MSENQTTAQAARQTGRLTFFEIADQQGVQAATDLMLRVVRMSSLLEEADVADWRKAYEDIATPAIDYTIEHDDGETLQLVTPSFRGLYIVNDPDTPTSYRWELRERDTLKLIGSGDERTKEGALAAILGGIAKNI